MSITLSMLSIMVRILTCLQGFRAAMLPLLFWDRGKPIADKTTTLRFFQHSGILVTNWALVILMKNMSSRHFRGGGGVLLYSKATLAFQFPKPLNPFINSKPEEVTALRLIHSQPSFDTLLNQPNFWHFL